MKKNIIEYLFIVIGSTYYLIYEQGKIGAVEFTGILVGSLIAIIVINIASYGFKIMLDKIFN